jgi:hypothetical protein
MQRQLSPAADKSSHMLLAALCQIRTHAVQQILVTSAAGSLSTDHAVGSLIGPKEQGCDAGLGSAAAWPLAAGAQQQEPVRRSDSTRCP